MSLLPHFLLHCWFMLLLWDPSTANCVIFALIVTNYVGVQLLGLSVCDLVFLLVTFCGNWSHLDFSFLIRFNVEDLHHLYLLNLSLDRAEWVTVAEQHLITTAAAVDLLRWLLKCVNNSFEDFSGVYRRGLLLLVLLQCLLTSTANVKPGVLKTARLLLRQSHRWCYNDSLTIVRFLTICKAFIGELEQLPWSCCLVECDRLFTQRVN